MEQLSWHEFHQGLGARFGLVNGAEVVLDYGDRLSEHAAMRESVGVLDLSFRSRLCVTGADRVRFLHGQVTNDVKRLQVGEGCYAALVTAKGRLESDMNIFCLADELLLDFEPGMSERVSRRLERYIVADDVQLVEVASSYGLLSVQGPQAEDAARELGLFQSLPAERLHFGQLTDSTLGEIYIVNQPRLGTKGFDLFVPLETLAAIVRKLLAGVRASGGRACGWQAFEIARIEAGIPRFGADMGDANFPQECGIEAQAVSYTKGCYVGQEVLNRIHTIGRVNRQLRGLRLSDGLKELPVRGDKLFYQGKEVGWTTSALASPTLNANIALAYVRAQANHIGTELMLQTSQGQSPARIVPTPF